MKTQINEIKRMQQLAGIISENNNQETLNEVGMNLPWITKEPESWGGKPDKESKWFVHGDLETAQAKGETPVEFIDFQDNRPDNDSVFVGTNMPAERAKSYSFNKGKVSIAVRVDDEGNPTGKYWMPYVIGGDDSILDKVKDWTPLNNFIKSKLSQPKPQAESLDQLDEIVDKVLKKIRSKK
jgi:hypothetical protein